MKRKLICAIALGALPALVHATGIIAVATCDGGGGAISSGTTCNAAYGSIASSTYGSVLQTFNNTLEWNTANSIASPNLTLTSGSTQPSADGNFATSPTTWSAVNAPISVSGSALELADNYVEVNKGGYWGLPTLPGPQSYAGTFDSQNSLTVPNLNAGTPGDYLLGSAEITGANPALSADQITFNSSAPFSSFGFRIASEDQTSFSVYLQLFGSGGIPIGGPLLLSNLNGGGQCATLAVNAPSQPDPVPCNSAPFIQVVSGTSVYSFSVYTAKNNNTTDTGGFFLDTFYYNNGVATPEPASLWLAGAGLASLLAFARRRNRG